jgi:transposase
VTGEPLFQPKSADFLAKASKEELVELIQRQTQEGQKLLETVMKTAAALAIKDEEIEQKKKENNELQALYDELKERHLILEGQHILLKNKFFGKAKNKPPTQAAARDRTKKKKNASKPKRKLPSERYPNAPLIERHVELKEPNCTCCDSKMTDSGMTEDSEYLTVIPAQFFVIRVKRHKYRCSQCHGDIKTAPVLPRIQPRSVLGDELIADVALSKYCDLIPIERYCSIAGRGGLEDLPPQILHESTHSFADFVSGAYRLAREDALSSRTLNADETPHKMLEGDDKKNWHLWGFLSKKAVYFEIRNTRSGDVASDVLIDSRCEYLMSDVYSGYGKAVRKTNEERQKKGLPVIRCVYCNAHVVRKFKEANEVLKQQGTADPECEWFIAQYRKIYDLDEETKCLHPEGVMELRKKMVPLFEEIKMRAEQLRSAYSSKSGLGKALQYFLNNYEGFILFTTDPELEIDNNIMERRLRNPVVGRKTWLGTHSQRGALTAAILFTLVESCRLIEINPRQYFKDLIQDLHQGKPPFSPYQYKVQLTPAN